MRGVLGVVAEFNPFHKGHSYLLKKAKKITGADYVICAMSGDYVQRGECACVSKYVRAEVALNFGCDVVLSMPVYCSLSSAGEFAEAYVKALVNAGIDALAFGCEDERIGGLMDYIKKHIMGSGSAIDSWAMAYMRMGDPYPVAREKAFRELCGMPEEFIEMLRSPNNLLIYEYMRTVCEMGAADRIRMIPIKRIGMAHHDEEAVGGWIPEYPSGSFIRKKMKAGEDIYDWLSVYRSVHKPLFWRDYSDLLYYRLLTAPKGELPQIKDVSEDLAGRITSEFYNFDDPEDYILRIKNKSVTYTRISRALMQTLLKLPKRKERPNYCYLLGYREEAAAVLHEIKKRGRIPMITKAADARKQLNWLNCEFYQMDVKANELYVRLASVPGKEPLLPDYKMQPVIVK